MRQIFPTYNRILKPFAKVCGVLGSISLMLLTLLTVSDVLMRYFLNRPILGSYELTEYLLIPIVFFSIPWATMQKSNVRVDLIVGKLRSKTRAKIYAFFCFLSIVIAFVFAWFTVPQALYIFRTRISSEMLDIPAYPFYFLTALSFFLLFFILIDNLIDFIEEAVAK